MHQAIGHVLLFVTRPTTQLKRISNRAKRRQRRSCLAVRWGYRAIFRARIRRERSCGETYRLRVHRVAHGETTQPGPRLLRGDGVHRGPGPRARGITHRPKTGRRKRCGRGCNQFVEIWSKRLSFAPLAAPVLWWSREYRREGTILRPGPVRPACLGVVEEGGRAPPYQSTLPVEPHPSTPPRRGGAKIHNYRVCIPAGWWELVVSSELQWAREARSPSRCAVQPRVCPACALIRPDCRLKFLNKT